MMAEWRAGRITSRDVVWASYWLARYGLGLADGIEGAFAAAVRSVGGTAEADLDARVRSWFGAEVAHRCRPGARAAIASHREAGDRVVLATSSTFYSARVAAEVFGFDDFVSTELVVADGVLTGDVASWCVGPAKADAVARWAERVGGSLADATFYTDSTSDLDLLERVGHPIVVNPDRALRRIAADRRWPVVDWGRAR
jgi:HAD superfamily hydrolase (TIGR01490 family)